MARLAAYYQEDFQYPVVGYGPRQRNSAYLLYEGHHNRMRSLATSEPTLAPKLPPSAEAIMKPLLYGSQMIETPRRPNSRLAGYETNVFDSDSVSSFGAYDNRCLSRQQHQHQHKDRLRKRFSYAEPGSGHHVVAPQRTLHDAEFTHYDKRFLHPEGYFVESSPEHPHAFYRPQSRQDNNKWHWISTPHGAPFLSPPSPLDSGLSSQSITSSPSLEAEPVSFRCEAFRNDGGHPRCLCPKMAYPPPPPSNRYDSGRISPGARSVAHHHHHHHHHSHIGNNKAMSYVGDDFDNNDHHQFRQVRYGKLGIVGEPTDAEQVMNSSTRRRFDNFIEQQSYPQNDLEDVSSYSEDQKHRRHKHQMSVHQNYTRPCVIIIESPEKGGERENSDDKGSVSPMSVTFSSESPSVSSSNNELDVDERPSVRTSNKTTESEIRELEDMYKKCNLNDRDLLDRAERRDLPTPHQGHRLTRSHSDTLYEVMGPAAFHNPYETPQRAPPLRRSCLPDRIADDMALRKLQKPSVSSPGLNPADNTITYMLCSTHFTPSVPVGHKDILFKDYPDVEIDDLSYRKHYFGKKNKIVDPQPPFGIPLRPPPPQKVFTDYLHAVPSSAPQPLCHARRNPDVVRDDLAFRTLRKEEPERMFYDISQFYKKSKR